MKDTEKIKIIAEPQMDEDVCRFIVDKTVFDGLAACKNKEMAEGSPLLEALFAIDGIREVLVSGNTVTIAKRTNSEWPVLGKEIGSVIRQKLLSGEMLIDEENLNKELPTNPELKARVQKVFEADVNPGLASHGGGAEVVDVRGTTVYVTLFGGCQGCASASQTLRYSIERILREKIPEVTEVIDVTDHSAGANPYF